MALKISTHLPHNLTVAGTNKRMCTKNKRSRTRCSWAGVANAGDRYIYAADSSGNRVIVFDVEQRQPIKAIKTHGFPYQVTYLAALDEVWILCWRNNLLDVIGDKSDGSTLIHHVRNASSLAVLHSIQAQVRSVSHCVPIQVELIISFIIYEVDQKNLVKFINRMFYEHLPKSQLLYLAFI